MGNTKKLTPEEVVKQLKKLADRDGFVTYKQPGIGGLRHAATREFGSWRKACDAAGVKARPRGRPKKETA